MVYIRTDLIEKELIQENPSDFVSLALDSCEKQESGIPKTAAA